MALSITFYNNIKYSKDDFMNRDRDLFGNGVMQADHFPLHLSAEPRMTFQVGDGVAWVDGYRIANDEVPFTLAVEPAAAEPRIDIVQIGHDDESQVAMLKVKKGVPGANPMEPGADPGFYKLYAIRVESGVTAIYEEDILDRRELVPLKVSGTQIKYNGAATVDANTFTGAQTAPSFIATDEAAPLQVPALDALPDAVGPEGTVCVVGNRWHISDGKRWKDMHPPTLQLPNLLDPSRMTFTRNTEAYRKNLKRTPLHALRVEPGKFGQAAYIEEGTTNLVRNSDFETVTGTGVMFSDSTMDGAAWKIIFGTGTFGATGLVATSDAVATAGHPFWRPLTGSNGQNLQLSAQATFVTGPDVSRGFLSVSFLPVHGSVSSRYSAEISLESSSFYLVRGVDDVAAVIGNAASVGFLPNTTYAVVLSIDANNLLTAKLYSGANATGTALAAVSTTDTMFPAATTYYQLALSLAKGSRATACSVTSPKPDGWVVGQNSRVAWALIQDAVSGSYSLSAKGVPGLYGRMLGTGFSVQPSASYSLSGYVKATESENAGRRAWIVLDFNNESGTYLSGIASQPVPHSEAAQRHVASGAAHAASSTGHPYLLVQDEGLFVFDALQVEQKAYATTYMRNDSSTSSAVRSADKLCCTLAEPLPGRYFAAVVWRPDRGSEDETTGRCDRTLLSTSGPRNTVPPHLLHCVKRVNAESGVANALYLGRVNTSGEAVALASEPFSYRAGDTIFAAYAEDAVNGQLSMWIGINGGPLKKYAMPCTGAADDRAVYVGCRFDSSTNAYEANGTIDHPLVVDRILSDGEVESLYKAGDWGGVRHWPGVLPQQVSIGKDTKISEAAKGVAQFSKPSVGTGIVMSATPLGNTYMTSNARYDEAADKWYRVDPSRVATMAAAYPGGLAVFQSASTDSEDKVTAWNVNQVLQALNGGYKVQSGSITWTSPQLVMFPVKYTAGTLPAVVVTPEYNNAWFGVMPMVDLVWENGAAIGFHVYLYTTGATLAGGGAAFGIHWMAIGI